MKRSSWVILVVGLIVVLTVLSRDDRETVGDVRPTLFVRISALTEKETEFLRKDIIPAFESLHDCRVSVEVYAPGELRDECQRQLTAGTIMTDVVLVDTARAGEWLDSDLLEPLHANIESWTDRVFSPSIIAGVTTDEAVHFVPWSAEANVLCFRKTAAAHLPAGAIIDKLTWQQLSEWVQTAAAADSVGVYAMEWSDESALTRQVGAMIIANGGSFPDVGSSAAAATWKLLVDMKEGIVPAGSADNTIADLMRIGEASIAVADMGTVEEIVRAEPNEFYIAPAPRGTATLGITGIVRGLGVTRGAPQGALAFHFIEYLTSPSIQVQLATGISGFAPVVDVSRFLGGGSAENMIVKVGSQSIQQSRVVGVPLYADWPAVEALYRSTFEDMVFTHGKVDAVVLRKANAELAGLRRRVGAARRGAR